VIIRAVDLPETLLVWQQPGYVDVEDPPTDRRSTLDPHGIYLERAGDRIFAAGSPLIVSVPATIALSDMICESFPNPDGGGSGDGAAELEAGP
jgi:hypothetical protein